MQNLGLNLWQNKIIEILRENKYSASIYIQGYALERHKPDLFTAEKHDYPQGVRLHLSWSLHRVAKGTQNIFQQKQASEAHLGFSAAKTL